MVITGADRPSTSCVLARTVFSRARASLAQATSEPDNRLLRAIRAVVDATRDTMRVTAVVQALQGRVEPSPGQLERETKPLNGNRQAKKRGATATAPPAAGTVLARSTQPRLSATRPTAQGHHTPSPPRLSVSSATAAAAAAAAATARRQPSSRQTSQEDLATSTADDDLAAQTSSCGAGKRGLLEEIQANCLELGLLIEHRLAALRERGELRSGLVEKKHIQRVEEQVYALEAALREGIGGNTGNPALIAAYGAEGLSATFNELRSVLTGLGRADLKDTVNQAESQLLSLQAAVAGGEDRDEDRLELADVLKQLRLEVAPPRGAAARPDRAPDRAEEEGWRAQIATLRTEITELLQRLQGNVGLPASLDAALAGAADRDLERADLLALRAELLELASKLQCEQVVQAAAHRQSHGHTMPAPPAAPAPNSKLAPPVPVRKGRSATGPACAPTLLELDWSGGSPCRSSSKGSNASASSNAPHQASTHGGAPHRVSLRSPGPLPLPLPALGATAPAGALLPDLECRGRAAAGQRAAAPPGMSASPSQGVAGTDSEAAVQTAHTSSTGQSRASSTGPGASDGEGVMMGRSFSGAWARAVTRKVLPALPDTKWSAYLGTWWTRRRLKPRGVWCGRNCTPVNDYEDWSVVPRPIPSEASSRPPASPGPGHRHSRGSAASPPQHLAEGILPQLPPGCRDASPRR